MKYIVRAVVVGLVVTGGIASMQVSSAAVRSDFRVVRVLVPGAAPNTV